MIEQKEQLENHIQKLKDELQQLRRDKINLENKMESVIEERDRLGLENRELKKMKDFIKHCSSLIDLTTSLGRIPSEDEVKNNVKSDTTMGNINWKDYTQGGMLQGSPYSFDKNGYIKITDSGSFTMNISPPDKDSGYIREENPSAKMYHPEYGYKTVFDDEIKKYEDDGWRFIEDV